RQRCMGRRAQRARSNGRLVRDTRGRNSDMRGAVIYAPGDIRFEERPDPTIVAPTDAIIRIAATCVCGSDLWSYRGVNTVSEPMSMGHEYVGVVEEVGADVSTVKP